MLKASKAQVHIFIQLFSHKVRLEIFLSLPANTSLCIWTLEIQQTKYLSFSFSVLHAAFKRYKQRWINWITNYFVSKLKLVAEHSKLVHGKKNDLSLHNVPMFFSMFCTKNGNIYDNSMWRNVSKLFLLDDKRTRLVRTAASFVL